MRAAPDYAGKFHILSDVLKRFSFCRERQFDGHELLNLAPKDQAQMWVGGRGSASDFCLGPEINLERKATRSKYAGALVHRLSPDGFERM